MKKLLLLLTFPTILFAQRDYKKLDSLTFKDRVESLLKDTGKNYKFYSFQKADNTKILSYQDTDNSSNILKVFYQKYNFGEDKNLEFKGTEAWYINSVTGSYLTLFPLWQKVADPLADREKLSKSGSKLKGDYSISQLEPGYWMMRF